MTVFPHQSSLSREERERIRREAEELIAANPGEEIPDMGYDELRFAGACKRLESALEQAELERDEAQRVIRDANDFLAEKNARLAKVPALVEALKEITAAGDEMTYVPEPRAHQIAADALAAWQEPE